MLFREPGAIPTFTAGAAPQICDAATETLHIEEYLAERNENPKKRKSPLGYSGIALFETFHNLKTESGR
jgi:hypothetical protein